MDVHPGDRAEACGGLMEPMRVEGTSSQYEIVHRCVRCGYEKRNMSAPDDDNKALVAVAKSHGTGDNRS